MNDFTQLSVCSYLDGTDLDRARTMAAEDPTISQRDIYHAACAGDAAAVRWFLDVDASLVNSRGGYFDWQPLMYACYSRVNLPQYSTLEVARVLLEHGADPNAYYMWGQQYRFTALTGVFGEGENGPKNNPEHPLCPEFARMLLEAGADPNDGQALYNRMFTPGHSCLKLLLEFGLSPEHKNNWLVHDAGGNLQPNEMQVLRSQLNWAIKSRYLKRALLLIDSGADLSELDGEKPLFEMAMLAGVPELAEHLVRHGAERVELPDTSLFVAACMAADRETAEGLLGNSPDLVQRTQVAQPELVILAAETGCYAAIRLMAALGVDLCFHGSPLHATAWHGDLKMVQLLVELGVDPAARDAVHNATAADWAEHRGGREEIKAYLNSLN